MRAKQHDRSQADKHDHQRGDRAVLIGAARGFGIDVGGERLEVERPQQERRRQFLHAIDENQDCRGAERGLQQRQMHAKHGAARALAEAARGHVEARRNLGIARFDAAGGDGEEADHIGEHERRPRAGNQQPGAEAESLPRRGVQCIVEGRQRYQQSDREHRSRDRVAERADARGRVGEPAAIEASGMRQHETEHERDRGGGRRKQDAVARFDHDVGGKADETDPRPGFVHQMGGRKDEADQHRRAASCERADAREARELGECGWVRAAAAAGKLPVPPAPAFQEHQREHGRQHDERDLRRARQARTVHPGRVDRDRERAYAEKFRSADIVQRLQQCQRSADGDGGTGERQRHAQEGRKAPGAERARDLERRRRLHEESRARGQIDIRIEHEAQEQDAAGQRAHIGQPKPARIVDAEQRPERGLDRAERMQKVEIGEGDDIGGDRERQQQRPVEEPAAGKAAGGDEPSGADADHDGDDTDAEQQQRGVVDRLRQYIGEEMRPQIAGALRGDGEEGDDRGQHDRGDEQRRKRPAAAVVTPGWRVRNAHGVRLMCPDRPRGATDRSRPCRPGCWRASGSWRWRRGRANRV